VLGGGREHDHLAYGLLARGEAVEEREVPYPE
jgi:hypothetical protein